jgi:hypothetical protein
MRVELKCTAYLHLHRTDSWMQQPPGTARFKLGAPSEGSAGPLNTENTQVLQSRMHSIHLSMSPHDQTVTVLGSQPQSVQMSFA